MSEEKKDAHGAAAQGDGKDAHRGGHKKHAGHQRGGHEEHEEGVPEWVVSFADNALLQMGFFVIMFAMNVGPKAKGESDSEGENAGQPTQAMLDAFIAIREAFNSPLDLNSSNPNDAPLIERMKERMNHGSQSSDGVPGKNPEQQAIKPSDFNKVTASASFEQGSSNLSSEARETAIEVAKRLRGQRFIVEIRGHTSSLETGGEPVKGMPLAHARALAFAAALIDSGAGLKWSQLRVVSCSDNERATPLAADRQQHRSNQRVEVVITGDTIAPDPHTREER